MIGSPSIQHKPPEPGYIEVVHQTQNGTPKYKGVGGWESETATPRPPSVPKSSCDTGPWGTGAVGHRGDHSNDPLTLQSHDQLDHTLRRVSATVLVINSMRIGLAFKNPRQGALVVWLVHQSSTTSPPNPPHPPNHQGDRGEKEPSSTIGR